MKQGAGERRCAIAVMAKAPREGSVKTRLVPPLSFAEAAQMSRAFLRDISENIQLAAQSAPIDGYIAYAPAGVSALFDGILAEGTRLILADGAIAGEPEITGFGRCLFQTIRDLLAMGYHSAVVLNSDSPTLPTDMLRRTADALAAQDEAVVLGPAEDGGYYLLGTTRPWPGLFERITWSTDQVADQTRQRAAELGLAVTSLDPWYDVDDRDGLQKLVDDLTQQTQQASLKPYPAPATASTLAALGHLAKTTLYQE